MPVEYSIKKGGRLIVELWFGKITPVELIQQEVDQVMDPDIREGAIAFTDIRRAKFDNLMSKDFLQLGNVWRQNPGKISEYVILARDEFDKARVFERVVKKADIKVSIHDDISAACDYLGYSCKEIKYWLEELKDNSE